MSIRCWWCLPSPGGENEFLILSEIISIIISRKWFIVNVALCVVIKWQKSRLEDESTVVFTTANIYNNTRGTDENC